MDMMLRRTQNSRTPRRVGAVATVIALSFAVTAAGTGGPAGAATSKPGGVSLPLSQGHRWVTDASGRAVTLHGLNQVGKVAPYLPSAGGFGGDDAAFLQRNGFNAMRVGVIWAAVEPKPGVYDDAYLAKVAATVQTLAAHGIVSLLDFHQDLANEKFGGEGFPSWAVQDGGLPHVPAGFPFTYFVSPAEIHTWDAFWANAPAADGVGLQDHYAAAWAHVAARFKVTPSVLGYELMNEPWPGSAYPTCLTPLIGCPAFGRTLTAFYQRVTDKIRTAEEIKTIWIEPNVLYSYSGAGIALGKVNDKHTALAFHDYCIFDTLAQINAPCPLPDGVAIATAKKYSIANDVPWMLTEFGATNDPTPLRELTELADRNMLSWLEWAYTGGDITSAAPDAQALVLDPSKAPTGSNVNTVKLAQLARPYPQAVAGTPTGWSFTHGVFRASWTTAKVAGTGRFGAGAQSVISTPVVEFPHGYTVKVVGGKVVSAANAAQLRIAGAAGATTVSVTVTPRA